MTTETKNALTNFQLPTNTNSSATSNLTDRNVEIKHIKQVSNRDRESVVKFRYPTNGLYGLL